MASASLPRVLTYPAGYLLFTATSNPIVMGSMLPATPTRPPQFAALGRNSGKPLLSVQGTIVKDALAGKAFVVVRNGQAALFIQPPTAPSPKFSSDSHVYPLAPAWLQVFHTTCRLNFASSVRIPPNELALHEPELHALVQG